MCSSRSGLLLARRGARIKSIPSRRAKRRRTHRHRRQSKDRHRRAKRRRTHRHRRQSKDRHRRAKRRRAPPRSRQKRSRRKARNGYADSKSFHAVPMRRPPSGRTGGMANRTRLPPQRQRRTPCATASCRRHPPRTQTHPLDCWPALSAR